MPGTSAGRALTRVMIVEDQQLIRRAFKTMLSLEPDLDVVAEAADGQEAVRLARLTRPDVILMDLQMPRLGGVAATRQILVDRPETRIIVLTTFDNDEIVLDAISAGAAAYLLLEEVLSHVTEHWKILFGPFLILVVLFARGGIAGLLKGRGL